MRLPADSKFFQEKATPPGARLAGWALMVHAFQISAPVRRPSCVVEGHVGGNKRRAGGWTVFDKRYWPGDAFADHLGFALRHEDIDLLILKRIFEAAPQAEVEALVRAAPTGSTARRAWYFSELLTGRQLSLDDAPVVTAANLLDPKKYFTGEPQFSKRHRIRDNLLGVSGFCPIIRRTKALTGYVALDLGATANELTGRAGARLVARAASFLLLADSRASFQIEGEVPPRNRLERWSRAVLTAGGNPLTLNEILRLQHVLIADTRFARPGLRRTGVFLGERDHDGGPLPEFIGARPEDLIELIGAMLAANDRMRKDAVDPVLQAAATAFGFVCVHPFEDGNGRLHRCLIHHVLAERGVTPKGVVLPISAVMLERIGDYRMTLQHHSGPLMPFIDWRPTLELNVQVLNDTADLYRYFDCTEAAEFLYGCVSRSIQRDLPREIDFLRRHDAAMRRIMDTVEMPDKTAEDFLMFVRRNEGTLPKRRRAGQFKDLRDDELELLEAIVRDAFEGFEDGSGCPSDSLIG